MLSKIRCLRPFPAAFLLALPALLALLAAGCRKSPAQGGGTEAALSQTAEQVLPPAYEKLSRTFSLLSPAVLAAIPNGNPADFLADLDSLLLEEASFGQEGGVGLLYLCDKQHYLPPGYAPADLRQLVSNDAYRANRAGLYLRQAAEEALRRMGRAARAEGIELLVSSSYRSYDYQVQVYNRLVALDGQEQTDRESARPGCSQHQLGTAVDFGSIDPSWESSAACQWLLTHAGDYGWSLSFPAGYEEATGYEYECWHFRYIGEKACAFQKKWFSNVQQYMLEFIAAWKQSQ